MDLVRRFFTGTGPTYDFMVNFGTFGCDKWWKKKILAHVPADSTRVLDLACGTGILTFAIAQKYPDCHVIGVDVTKEYLDVARTKAKRLRLPNVEFVHRRAEEAFFEKRFDCVTASYLAKYADLKNLTQNVNGMLKADGFFVMHDFTYPSNRLVASLWEFYFKLQQTGGVLFYPQWRTIYHELPILLRKTTWVPDLVHALRRNGFSLITVERLTLGSAAIVTARKGSSIE
jgi:demethylmenaquinone methyltransferase / 2-methoxy-6-polyprenyl-1,4-benzoquinol methylase